MPRHAPLRLLALTMAALAAGASPARADITAFLGTSRVNTPPGATFTDQSDTELRTTKGLAVGFGLVIVGFEFEYSNTSGNDDTCGTASLPGSFRLLCAPSLTTGMANVLLQTPHGLTPVQVYGTIGAGMYREHYDLSNVSSLPDENDYGVGTNLGGGVKINLVGPLRLRVDYRIFKLANGAFNKTPQRFYAGANLSF
jgi:opacity protein-like surface antigen